MNSVTDYIVYRRDMYGECCLFCDVGEYWCGLGDEQVVCQSCGHALPRWLSKREILAHGIAALEASDEEATVLVEVED